MLSHFHPSPFYALFRTSSHVSNKYCIKNFQTKGQQAYLPSSKPSGDRIFETARRMKKVCRSLIFLICILGGGIQGPLGTAVTNRPIVSAPGDYDDEEIGGMIDRGNRSTRRKPAPVPLCPPQMLHDLTGP
jgi:hypothetical protein